MFGESAHGQTTHGKTMAATAAGEQPLEIEVQENFKELEIEFTDSRVTNITIDTVVCGCLLSPSSTVL